MLVVEFLVWWYTRGWSQTVVDLRRRLVTTSRLFSMPILLRTLFAPWRRIITYPSDDLAARFRALGDNLVSRGVGFAVRLLTLLTAGSMLLVMAVISVSFIVLWPLLPPAIILALIKGCIG